MDVEDEVVLRAVDVCDFGQGLGGAIVDEGGDVCPFVAWEEDGVVSVVGAGFADGRHSGLNGVGPGVNVDVVLGLLVRRYWMCVGRTYWLVHDTKSNLGVVSVLGGDLGPERGELSVRWAALTNDLAVPSGVVVDIDDAHLGRSLETPSDESIVVFEVGLVEFAT